MNVGFIGLGNMGQPMARNLLKAGHKVTVFNRTRKRAEDLEAEGAAVAERPADAACGDVVMTMLADDQALEAIVFGSGGLLAALAPDTVHVSISTIGVALSQRLVETHAQAKRTFVSAPVFGRPEAAAAAKLLVVAAGPPAAIERCRPLFDVLGSRIVVVGADPVLANVIKLAGNFLIAAAVESLAEAFTLVRKSGVDPKLFFEIMTDGMFAGTVYKNYGNMIVHEKYAPAGFKVALGLKDVRLALAAGDAVNVPLPAANAVRDHLLIALARGQQDFDWTVIARLAAEDAGL